MSNDCCQDLRDELIAAGLLGASSPSPSLLWTAAGVIGGVASKTSLQGIVVSAIATAIVENFPVITSGIERLVAEGRDIPPVVDAATLEMLVRGIAENPATYVGANRFVQYGTASYALSPLIVEALYSSESTRDRASQIYGIILAQLNEEQRLWFEEHLPQIEDMVSLDLVSMAGTHAFEDWPPRLGDFIPAFSFLRRLSEGESFGDDPHLLAEAEMFFSPDFQDLANVWWGVGPELLSGFSSTMYPDEFAFLGVPGVQPSAYPDLYRLFERWLMLDEANRGELLSLVGRIQPVLDNAFLPRLYYTDTVDENGVSYLLQALASSPFLLEQLAAAQGGEQSLLSAVVSDPSLITSLAASPTFTQVLSEMFADETLQQTFAQELFGDIEEADSPIRAAIASAFGDLADADNPIAQQLVQGVLGAVDPENPGSSLGGAVRQVVQDVLDTPETGVRPRLERLEAQVASDREMIVQLVGVVTGLQDQLTQLRSPTYRPAQHNPKTSWQPVITEG